MKMREVTSCQASDTLYLSHLVRPEHVVLQLGQAVRAQKWNLEIVVLHCTFLPPAGVINFVPIPQSAGQPSLTSLGS